jgi:hypothetical protein
MIGFLNRESLWSLRVSVTPSIDYFLGLPLPLIVFNFLLCVLGANDNGFILIRWQHHFNLGLSIN